jgi:hypothetical protein
MKNNPTEGVATHPDPVVVAIERPMTVSDVRRKALSHDASIRYPHATIASIVDPDSVRIEVGPKHG